MNPLTIPRHPSTYRFPLPNDIWVQKLKPQAFAILAYLQYRSCRKIHWPISSTAPAGRSTVCLLSGSWPCVQK